MVLSAHPSIDEPLRALPDPLSGFDPFGQVFHWKGRILRGVRRESLTEAQRLLDCGLVPALEEASLLPATRIAEVSLPGFALTLEHQRVHPLVLAGEWTFAMARQAALALLDVNRIARRFGYESKDAHLYNIAFVGTRPMFFDLGSLVRRTDPAAPWQAHDEFVRGVLYPLRLGAAGPSMLRMLLDYQLEHLMTHEDYVRLRAGALAPYLPVRPIARLRRAYASALALGSSNGRAAAWLAHHPRTAAALHRLRRSGMFAWLSGNPDRLAARVNRIRRSSRMRPLDRVSPSAELIQALCAAVGPLRVETALLLDGGNGELAMQLIKRDLVGKLTSADADGEAVEAAFNAFSSMGSGRATAALIDFLEDSRSVRALPVPGRYRAQLAVLLESSATLLGRRGVAPELLVDRLSRFCTDCAILRLERRDNATLVQFGLRFEVVDTLVLSSEAVLLVGRKRSAGACSASS